MMLEGLGLKNDPQWRRFLFRWLGIAFVLHFIAAVWSEGFYHADEHFQIIEFANLKLGRCSAADLPMEYGNRLRPWLYPALLTGVTKSLLALGIQSPFTWAFFYRAFASFAGWCSLVGLALCTPLWFESRKWREICVMLSTLIWYMPSLHARHSSENLSGSLMAIAVSILVLASPLQKQSTNKGQIHPEENSSKFFPYFLTGIVLGFSFEFRYQIAFMIVGLILWLLFVRKIKLSQLLSLTIGFSLPIVLGTLLDRWGYSQWTFTPWNYFQYNILQSHLSDSDTSPAWDYFRRAITESWPILGLLTLICFPVAWIAKPKNIITWSTAPFFLAHAIIGHKELRFLFPMLHFGGVMVALSADSIWTLLSVKVGNFERRARWLLGFLVPLNFLALICFLFVPAWMPIRFYSQLYFFRQPSLSEKSVTRLFYKDDSLFNFGGARMTFYRPTHLSLIPLVQYSDLLPKLQQNEPSLLFYFRMELPEDAGALRNLCTPVFSTLPNWIEQLPLRKNLNQVTNWTLFQCQASPENMLANPNGNGQ